MIEDIIAKIEYNLDNTDKDAQLSRQEQRVILTVLKLYYEAKITQEKEHTL